MTNTNAINPRTGNTLPALAVPKLPSLLAWRAAYDSTVPNERFGFARAWQYADTFIDCPPRDTIVDAPRDTIVEQRRAA